MNQKPIEILVTGGGVLILLGYFLPWSSSSINDPWSGIEYAKRMHYLGIPFLGGIVLASAYFILLKKGMIRVWVTVTRITSIMCAIFIGYRLLTISRLGGLYSTGIGLFFVIVGIVIAIVGSIGSAKKFFENSEESPYQASD
jgi:hypothetical protein